MAGKGKAGRKKEIDTVGWKNFSMVLPDELWRALRHHSYQQETSTAAVIRELVEKLLEKNGLIKIEMKKDSDGRELRSYKLKF